MCLVQRHHRRQAAKNTGNILSLYGLLLLDAGLVVHTTSKTSAAWLDDAPPSATCASNRVWCHLLTVLTFVLGVRELANSSMVVYVM